MYVIIDFLYYFLNSPLQCTVIQYNRDFSIEEKKRSTSGIKNDQVRVGTGMYDRTVPDNHITVCDCVNIRYAPKSL